jgi:hypothetical protein
VVAAVVGRELHTLEQRELLDKVSLVATVQLLTGQAAVEVVLELLV